MVDAPVFSRAILRERFGITWRLARPFPIEVVVNNVRVTVTLLLKPGTTVEQANDAARDSTLRGPETGTAPDDKAR